jgi:hypothetical protein
VHPGHKLTGPKKEEESLFPGPFSVTFFISSLEQASVKIQQEFCKGAVHTAGLK